MSLLAPNVGNAEQQPRVLVKQTSAGIIQINTADNAKNEHLNYDNINQRNSLNLQNNALLPTNNVNKGGLFAPQSNIPATSPPPTMSHNNLSSFTQASEQISVGNGNNNNNDINMNTSINIDDNVDNMDGSDGNNDIENMESLNIDMNDEKKDNNLSPKKLRRLSLSTHSSFAEQEPLFIELKLKIIEDLQPNELLQHINECVNMVSGFHTTRDANKILYVKEHILKGLEKLKLVRKALLSINNINKVQESIPKHPLTNMNTQIGLDMSLREQSFYAGVLGYFGMLLIEVCDIVEINKEYGMKYGSKLIKSMLKRISTEFIHKHLIFERSIDKLVALIYVNNESELMEFGNTLIDIVGGTNFKIYDKNLQSSVSIGASLCGKNKDFDMRQWSRAVEVALSKSKQIGLNKCCVSNENDMVNISNINMTSLNMNRKHKTRKSNLSLLASKISGSNKNKNQLQLTPNQIRLSLKLFDKINTITNTNNNNKIYNDKLILSLILNYYRQQIEFNFQHPKYNQMTILMLSCKINKPINILIKYFCLKLYKTIQFNLVDTDGNNALMLYILNNNKDLSILKMLAQRTVDKSTKNKEGKTAKDIAEDLSLDETIINCLI